MKLSRGEFFKSIVGAMGVAVAPVMPAQVVKVTPFITPGYDQAINMALTGMRDLVAGSYPVPNPLLPHDLYGCSSMYGKEF